MDSSENAFSELFGFVKSWIPWRSEPPGVSRDFWMPDQSCRVCYDCDSQFTVLNRRHHCRLCGRIFCAKCTSNSVPFPFGESSARREEWDKMRVCNYCFKQWQEGASFDNGTQDSCQYLAKSPSVGSFATSKSSNTPNSSSMDIGSLSFSSQPYHQRPSTFDSSAQHTIVMDDVVNDEGRGDAVRAKLEDISCQSSNHYVNRSDDEEDEYSLYRSDSDTRHYDHQNCCDHRNYCYNHFESPGNNTFLKSSLNGEASDFQFMSSSSRNQSFDAHGLEGPEIVENHSDKYREDGLPPNSVYHGEEISSELVDFESNAVLWLPPEPEDEEDEKEDILSDDECDDDNRNVVGEWGRLPSSSSFGNGEFRSRDKSTEEHRKVMKNVVDGHFRALVSQLLQVENVAIVDEDSKDSWLDIITSLSWEAATLLKPDMSKGSGMDPGGYVKVKCVACGRRSDSMVVKGVVCKKNVAHRRMTSKITKPRILILGGALEYQRVTNHLSSFDTLLQQEMDYLKMAVAKIDAQHPNVLLVEKAVSRFAQDYLLGKDISLVLNIKRPLLERIARCSGAHITPSIDHLSTSKLGSCESFYVKRFMEDLGSAGQFGKKLSKTLMYFEGCPKPFGYTILLKGANGDELKKVKHVVQYGVFAAYHLALETSFLADEGASLHELPLNSPINVALPDKSLSIERSISTVAVFSSLGNEKSSGSVCEPRRSNSVPSTCLTSTLESGDNFRNGQHFFYRSHSPELASCQEDDTLSNVSISSYPKLSLTTEGSGFGEFNDPLATFPYRGSNTVYEKLTLNGSGDPSGSATIFQSLDASSYLDGNYNAEEVAPLKEEFPPSPSDHLSILVSLSSRCVLKGSVCERAHLFRIKYYGSFDKPLGRFLRDHLFDQSHACHSCEMPSAAHVYCYTHRQGTLTISVKTLPQILPGEGDGKIWMWHRCLKCPRSNNFPPATRRVVMSDAAWGLSFGKFLELSFSNHAAASRVASCGHSLHRDCLRFYGFGRMVACFRYASIDVLSVHVPPPKLDFNHKRQDWIQREKNELVEWAELLFSEVLNALAESNLPNGIRVSEGKRQIADLELLLQKEKAEFEECLNKILTRDLKDGQPVIDILDINKLQRHLIFLSYMWDRRLVFVARLVNNDHCDIAAENGGKINANTGKSPESNGIDGVDERLSRCGSSISELNGNKEHGVSDIIDRLDLTEVHKCREFLMMESNLPCRSGSESVCEQPDLLESREITESDSFVEREAAMADLSDTLDAAWTGESNPGTGIGKGRSNSRVDLAALDCASTTTGMENIDSETLQDNQSGAKINYLSAAELFFKGSDSVEDIVSFLKMPFLNFYWSINKTPEKVAALGEYVPVYASSFRELEIKSGARLLLPLGVNETVIPVFDDEPTSIISYALTLPEYHAQLVEDGDRASGELNSLPSELLYSPAFSLDDGISETYRSLSSAEEGFRSILDPLSYTKALHVRVSFGDDGPLGKVRYSVTCYYAKRFEALRKICCPTELDFIRSLSRCKKWGAQGGKSNVFFAKTLDDRFIIKQVTKTELESFIKFAPEYFKYLSESIGSRSPTCLAKILGIYQVSAKHLKGGKESKMDLLVMENLLFERKVTRLYDLKGSSRSRYNPDSKGSDKVLLDQNLIETMPTSPIFVGNKAKRVLERAVWNDTSFLASIDVMDYSLLVGVDEEKHELVLGIIDFMRQYTWDKHLETWVKASGILGGPKNTSPTVISPKQYKKRFRKAMTAYFLMVPEWSPPTLISSSSQSELCNKMSPESGNQME